MRAPLPRACALFALLVRRGLTNAAGATLATRTAHPVLFRTGARCAWLCTQSLTWSTAVNYLITTAATPTTKKSTATQSVCAVLSPVPLSR